MRYLLIAAVSLVCLVGCTDEGASRKALMYNGFSDIEITGYAWFGCSDSDTYHTGFRAKNAKGQPVEGVVCCGVMKACTVRF